MDCSAGKEKIICQIFDAGKKIHLNGGVFENSFEHSVRLRLQVQVEQQETARGDCLATGGCKGENKKDVFKNKVQVLFHLFGQLWSVGYSTFKKFNLAAI